MKAGWSELPLDVAAEVIYGTRVVKKEHEGTAYPVYGGGGATFKVDAFNRENCMIVSRFGMSEECVRWVDGKFFLNDSGLSVQSRDKSVLCQRFLDIQLFGRQTEIYALGRGTAQRNLDLTAFRSMPLVVPPLEEQQRIVAILDEAFEGLDRACAHAEANVQNARELFESYREMTLDLSGKSGWCLTRLEDLVQIKHGFAFKSEHFVEQGDFAVLTPGNYYETGGFRDRGEKQKYYSGQYPAEFLLKKGALLMAMTEQAPGLLGSCIIVPEDDAYLHNQRLGLISPKEGVSWHAEYFSHAFNLKSFRRGLSDTCSGATVRHTSPARILAESIPYTKDLNELENTAARLTDLENDCRAMEHAYRTKVQDIDHLRQCLLEKAFAGELTRISEPAYAA